MDGSGDTSKRAASGGPTPEEAAETLSAVRGAMRGGRRAAVGEITRAPLVIWGVVWCVDYTALEILPEAVAMVFAAILAAVAFGLSRRAGGSADSSSGWEREVVGAWWVLLLGSVGLAVIVEPVAKSVLWLLLGAFWGIALMLYAVVARDGALGVLGGGILILAAALRVTSPPLVLLLFGLLSGGSMAVLGLAHWLKSPERGRAMGGG